MSARQTTAAATVVAIGTLAAMAGCGGSAPLSQADLIARGDALCAKEQLGFAQTQAQPPSTAPAVVDQTQKLIEIASAELDALRGLAPPTTLRASYDQYLQAKQQALDLLKQGHDAAQRQDSRRYAQLQNQVAKAAPERQRLARAVGFKTCSASQQKPGSR